MTKKDKPKAKRPYHRKPKPEVKSTDVIIPASKERVIRDVYAPNLNDSEWDVFKMVCVATRLNPAKKQIVPVKRWNKQLNREVMTPQTTIDGYRAIAARNPEYAGQDDAVYEYDAQGNVLKATVVIYKMVQGVRVPFATGTAFTKEYKPADGQDFMWKSKPHVMIAKCAEALAHRKAFPEDTAGVYIEEEMSKIDNSVSVLAVNNDQKVFDEMNAATDLESLNQIVQSFTNMKEGYKLSAEGWPKAMQLYKHRKSQLVPTVAAEVTVQPPVETKDGLTDAEKEEIRKQEAEDYQKTQGQAALPLH